MPNKEIGSEFSYNIFDLVTQNNRNNFNNYFNLQKYNFLFLNTGRAAIKYLFSEIIKNSKVLLPSYLCPSIIQPFKELGIKYEFYKSRKDLSIDLEDIEIKIKNGFTSLFFINYFGFYQSIEIIDKLRELKKEKEILIIEDCTHSLLSYNNEPFDYSIGDYQICSLRKWVGIPDGAMIISKEHNINNNLKLRYNDFIINRLISQLLKNEYLINDKNDKDYFLKLFNISEELCDKEILISKISDISLNLLNGYNFDDIKRKRFKNYRFLFDNFVKDDFIKPLFYNLDETICPIGFPIIVNNDRDRLRKYLSNNDVYCPIHWYLNDIIPNYYEESNYISSSILTIPCDQRYSIDDMKYILDVISCYRGEI